MALTWAIQQCQRWLVNGRVALRSEARRIAANVAKLPGLFAAEVIRWTAARGGDSALLTSPMKLNHQAIGAFGERAVEAELLRRGWIPANVNATVKNAADFDIYAVKKGHTVHLRVRACGPDLRAFQFGGFEPGLR